MARGSTGCDREGCPPPLAAVGAAAGVQSGLGGGSVIGCLPGRGPRRNNRLTMDAARQAWLSELDGLLSARLAAARLGIEEGTLQAAATAGEIIELVAADGDRFYPGFQFQRGWPPAALVDAWRLIADASDPWTAASWAATPDDALDGRRPADCARGADAARMLKIARQDAIRLAA